VRIPDNRYKPHHDNDKAEGPRVISSPQVSPEIACGQRITGGETLITGRLGEREAKDLALLVRAGALPVPVEVVERRTIGPTLGAAAIRASMEAALLGAALTIAYMVAYYSFGALAAAVSSTPWCRSRCCWRSTPPAPCPGSPDSSSPSASPWTSTCWSSNEPRTSRCGAGYDDARVRDAPEKAGLRAVVPRLFHDGPARRAAFGRDLRFRALDMATHGSRIRVRAESLVPQQNPPFEYRRNGTRFRRDSPAPVPRMPQN